MQATFAKMYCSPSYEIPDFAKTNVFQFDLVCDRTYLSSLATSLYIIGALIGSLVLGNIADRCFVTAECL